MAADDLAAQRCEPCRAGVAPLTPDEAGALHAGIPAWELAKEATRLRRTFKWKDFREAMAFVNRLADLAEAEAHHPDIAIHWNRVDLELYTHKIKGLHRNDFIMAAKIDRLAEGARPA